MSTVGHSVEKYTGCPAGQLCGSPLMYLILNHNQKKTVYYFKTDGPNIKTGGLTGYNWEIALFEALNL